MEGLHGHLEIHDCLGCPLYRRPALGLADPGYRSVALRQRRPDTLEASPAAAATVKASERMRDRPAAPRTSTSAPRPISKPLASGHGNDRPERRAQGAAGRIRLVANSDLSVLITGETGVGKELVAQSIHRHSMRSGKPMISLNRAALPETLVESELFGHVRGAFSGAVNERRGKFELADGGSLFLDEVGELPLAVQAKLLRVLQSGQLQRVGSDREHRVDVRLIAATNRDLAEEVRAGRFRADLYHRLSVYPLRVPRERGRDILLLAGYFLEENRPRLGLRSLRLDHEAQAALLDYRWPGNVRELEHLVGRASRPRHNPERSRIVTLHRQDLDLPAETPRHLAAWSSPRPPRQRPVTRCARPPTPTNAT